MDRRRASGATVAADRSARPASGFTVVPIPVFVLVLVPVSVSAVAGGASSVDRDSDVECRVRRSRLAVEPEFVSADGELVPAGSERACVSCSFRLASSVVTLGSEGVCDSGCEGSWTESCD